MMKGLMVDDNMSNLTFASGEISASSSTRNDQSVGNLYPQNSSASTNQLPPPPNKKKRSLPGNPGPNFLKFQIFFFFLWGSHIYSSQVLIIIYLYSFVILTNHQTQMLK